MKKLVLMTVLTLFAFNVSAQDGDDDSGDGGWSVEFNVGLPIGDAGDFTSFAVSANFRYTWEVTDGFQLGPTTGYGHWFGKDGISDLQFVPVAANLEAEVSDGISAGGDVGYAINVGSGGGGDFYYNIRIAVEIADDSEVTGSFANISGTGVTFSAIQVGYRLGF